MQPQFLERLIPIETITVKYPEYRPHPPELFRGKSLPFQTNLVVGSHHRWSPVGDEVGRQVVDEFCECGKHGIRAHPAELVHATITPNHNMILDGNVSREN